MSTEGRDPTGVSVGRSESSAEGGGGRGMPGFNMAGGGGGRVEGYWNKEVEGGVVPEGVVTGAERRSGRDRGLPRKFVFLSGGEGSGETGLEEGGGAKLGRDGGGATLDTRAVAKPDSGRAGRTGGVDVLLTGGVEGAECGEEMGGK
jgi:hypothetical protein